MKQKKALIVAGPTASGKSALALALAERLGGTIINADAMQVYRELRVLTARPTPEDEARVPHALYGVRPAAEPGNVAWWREAALAAMAAAREAGRLPILTGGSGLYFASLTDGLADIPDPGPAARAEARALLKEIGPAALHARLAEVDPATAARLRPTDSQRIARAWEVWRGTGTGPRRLAGEDGAARAVAVRRHPARPAARRAARGHRGALRRDAAGRCARGGAGAAGAAPRPGAAGDARARRAGTRPPICAARSRWRRPDAGSNWSPASTPSARRPGSATTRWPTPAHLHTIHARIRGSEQFSERINPQFLAFIESMG